jgi:hypothetical protein
VGNCSARTIENYTASLERFRQTLQLQHLADATQLGIQRYLTGLSETLRPASVHFYFRPLKTFFLWCVETGLVAENPTRGIRVRVPRMLPHVLAAVLGEDRRTPAVTAPSPGWLGAYVEPETALAVRIEAEGGGRVCLRYGNRPERLDLQADGTAESATARLRLDDGALWMDRLQENQSSRLTPRRRTDQGCCRSLPLRGVGRRIDRD